MTLGEWWNIIYLMIFRSATYFFRSGMTEKHYFSVVFFSRHSWISTDEGTQDLDVSIYI